MHSTESPHAPYDDLLKKIGRNLLLFQQAEHLIKRLLTLKSLSIQRRENQEEIEERLEKFAQMSLGQVVPLYLSEICPDDPALAEPVAVLDSIRQSSGNRSSVHFRIRFGGNPEERKQSLAALIRQRNEFVHQLLPKIDPGSVTSCAAMASEMEDVRQAILPEILRLQQDLKLTRDALDAMLDFIESPVGNVDLQLPEIQQSPLIRNLAEIAARSTAPGAWTLLSDATRQVQDIPQSQIRTHHLQFNLKSLSELLKASRMFQVHFEPNERGGHNTFYRLKSHTPKSHQKDSVDG